VGADISLEMAFGLTLAAGALGAALVAEMILLPAVDSFSGR
jgi:hypothetical protein